MCAEVQRSVKDIQEATKMTMKTQKSLKSKIKKGRLHERERGRRERERREERERERERKGERERGKRWEGERLGNCVMSLHKLTWAFGLQLLPIMGYGSHSVY